MFSKQSHLFFHILLFFSFLCEQNPCKKKDMYKNQYKHNLHLHVRIINKGIKEVGCLSKQSVRLPGDWGDLQQAE